MKVGTAERHLLAGRALRRSGELPNGSTFTATITPLPDGDFRSQVSGTDTVGGGGWGGSCDLPLVLITQQWDGEKWKVVT